MENIHQDLAVATSFKAPNEPDAKKANLSLGASVKSIVAEYCLSTTAHGLPNVVRAESWPLRLIWLVCLLGSTAYCIYTIISLIVNFASWPVISNVAVVNELPTKFPTVMVCNANPFNMSSARMQSVSSQVSVGIPSVRYPYPNLIAKQIQLKASIYDYYSNGTASSADMQEYGYKLSNMLLYCRFRTIECNSAWFEYVYDFDYVNCYKFNGNGSFYIGKAGSFYGLQLELYIGNSSNLEQYTENRGLRIAVYNESIKNPFIYDQGFDIQPGVITNIQVKKTLNERLSSPYSDCLDDLTSSSKRQSRFMRIAFDTMNQTQYSQIYCQNVCLQSATIENCNCSFMSLPPINTSVAKCTSGFLSMQCYTSVLTNFSIDPSTYCQDECPDPCNTQTYDLSVSTSQYLTNWYWNQQNSFTSTSEQGNVYQTVSSFDIDQARENIVRLNIYYESLGYTWITESPLYTVDTLLAGVGGNLGLFVGISLLSFVEVFELIYLVIGATIRHFVAKAELNRKIRVIQVKSTNNS